VAPLLFSLLFGITEIGRALYVLQMLTAAAREGVRVAATTAPDVDAVSVRVHALLDEQAITPAAIAVEGPDADRLVRVRVEADFEVMSGSILEAFSGTFRLRASSAMRSEV
jgi:Flp pilus assembly protein TadG